MEGPNGPDRPVRADTVASEDIDAHAGRVSSVRPRSAGVDFSPTVQDLPRKVGGDPTACLRSDASASLGPVVREMHQANISSETHRTQRVACVNPEGGVAFGEDDGLVVVAVQEHPTDLARSRQVPNGPVARKPCNQCFFGVVVVIGVREMASRQPAGVVGRQECRTRHGVGGGRISGGGPHHEDIAVSIQSEGSFVVHRRPIDVFNTARSHRHAPTSPGQGYDFIAGVGESERSVKCGR